MAQQDTSTASGAVGISYRLLSVERAETMSGRSGTEGKQARQGKKEGSPPPYTFRVRVSRRFIYKWVQRFVREGLERLQDKLGRRRRIEPLPHNLRDQS
jgi:transposase